MFKQINSDFEENFVMPELERRKQMLANIRNFMTPIRIAEIRQHSQQKKDLLNTKLKEYVKKRQFYIDCNNDNSNKYESKFWEIVKKREENEASESMAKKEDVKSRAKKKNDYARNAMELYKPKISKKKQLEMTLIRQNMDDPTSMTRIRKGLKSTQHKHNKSMITSVDRGVGSDTLTSSLKKGKHTKPKPPDESRYTYTMNSPERHAFIKHDYLTKQRVEKAEKTKDDPEEPKLEVWMNEVNKANLNDGEKIDYIKMKSAQLEEELARKEQMMKIKNSNSMNETSKLNSILIDSIKTKLNLLNELKSD